MDDEGVKVFGERVEVYDIADDEQLIGETIIKVEGCPQVCVGSRSHLVLPYSLQLLF